MTHKTTTRKGETMTTTYQTANEAIKYSVGHSGETCRCTDTKQNHATLEDQSTHQGDAHDYRRIYWASRDGVILWHVEAPLDPIGHGPVVDMMGQGPNPSMLY